MELKRAKEVLEGMGVKFIHTQHLSALAEAPRLIVYAHGKAELMGVFAADQLEAIATWMRDPEGVVNSDKNPNAWDDLDTYGPSA
ncbi:MAG: hypothetical protein ACYC1K_03460 [Minisyncoccota bacterium]